MIPKTFEDLAKMSDFLAEVDGSLLRLAEHQEFYKLYTKHVPRESVLAILNEQLGDNEVAFTLNNFPYSLVLQDLPHVTHYCLWSRKGKLSESEIEDQVIRKFGISTEWFFSERKPGKKSVPEIWHCHVFINQAI